MTSTTAHRHGTPGSVTAGVLRAITAAALIVDAVVHLRLASGYQQSAPSGIGAGNLFRIEAAAALIVGAWVIMRGSRRAFMGALIVGLSAVGAVVLYRYVDIPAVGPLPGMYEPVWFFEKSLSAVAEAVAAVAALMALVVSGHPSRDRAATGGSHDAPTRVSRAGTDGGSSTARKDAG
ncbi:hypothetical protein [Terrabacter carboxydivorans]|uniref:Integral membrane protein n=1 Tax=Terrabacter carboxydivorans TaxID=619730 RepID=A0ABP5ZXL3_9MICO